MLIRPLWKGLSILSWSSRQRPGELLHRLNSHGMTANWLSFRTQARERLLTFILELADTSVNYELSNWRAATVGLILLFFDVLLDPKDVIPDNIIILKTLQPTQLNAMSMCFEEHLVKGSDERRLVLLTKLSRLRMSIPQWASESRVM